MPFDAARFYTPESRFSHSPNDYESFVRGISSGQADYLSRMDSFYASLEEQQRQFDQGLGEQQRQFDLGFLENVRQFDNAFGENKRQFDETLYEQGRQFDVTADLKGQELGWDVNFRNKDFNLSRDTQSTSKAITWGKIGLDTVLGVSNSGGVSGVVKNFWG